MPRLVAVVMAAGQGTRMKSKTPKVLHALCGRPLVRWPVEAALRAGADRVVVVGGPDRALDGHLPGGVELAVQHEAKGTGDAVLSAREHFGGDDVVVVLSGDVPLITAEAIKELAAAHAGAGVPATMATMVLDDPGQYGRVIRSEAGDVVKVVEAKAAGDATAEELAIREVNTGIYAFSGGPLGAALTQITNDNAQGEYYLPDVLPILGRTAAHVVDDPALTLGVNDRNDLALVRREAQRRINAEHGRNGVTIVHPETTAIDADVTIGADTVIEPGCVLRGRTRVGEDCRIGPGTTLIDATIGDACTVLHAYISESTAEDGVTIGPFVHLRQGTVLREGAKAGTFVEMKKTEIGEGAKVPHLSYLGDATVGARTNIGASTITANYDGRHKHPTTIGANVRTSVDTTFVAPVTVGDGAVTGAGSVITEDVPAGALAIARARQVTKDGYARRKG